MHFLNCDGTQEGCVKVLRHNIYIRLRHCRYTFWRRRGEGGHAKSKCTSAKQDPHLTLHYPHQREVVVSPDQYSVVIRGLSSILWEDKLVFMEIKSNHYLFLSENTALRPYGLGAVLPSLKRTPLTGWGR